MKNEEESVIYTLDGITVGYPQHNRVYICGRDVTDYKTWKEFEQIVTAQSKQIRSLEEQLKNAEIRKYKLNEEVYVVWHEMVIDVRIYAYWRDKEYYYVDTCHFDLSEEGGLVLKESDIFKEYEEAQARLAELKGEGK